MGQNIVAHSPTGTNMQLASLEEQSYIEGSFSYEQIDFFSKSDLIQLVKRSKCDLVINTAAMTNVDLCETEKEKCNVINRDAVGWIASCGIPMIHYSTDYVFDGNAGPYSEESTPNPLGHYGQSKLESEGLVFGHNPNSLVLRTMLLWGVGRNLRPSFTDFVKSSLEKNQEINIVTDQYGNPTLASDLAKASWALISKRQSGLFHCSGSEILSRFQWAEAVADYFGLPKALIHPLSSAQLNQKAPRPLNSGFSLGKIEKATGFFFKNLKAQLKEVYG